MGLFFSPGCLNLKHKLVKKMIRLLVADKEAKVKDIVAEILDKPGNINVYIRKQGDILEVIGEEDIREMVSLEDKVIELERSLYDEKKGSLYKAIMDVVEKPLIEFALERTEGNQMKAARILGINRNTIRVKIKRLGIHADKWKVL
jgi:DNA-binding protein Fis